MIGFLACVAVRSTGLVPAAVLAIIEQARTIVLGGALFGMGTAVHVATLIRSSGRALGLAFASTLVVGGVSLVGVDTLT